MFLHQSDGYLIQILRFFFTNGGMLYGGTKQTNTGLSVF